MVGKYGRGQNNWFIVSLDIRKAFDSINHHVPITRYRSFKCLGVELDEQLNWEGT